jgi:hypothetical protein
LQLAEKARCGTAFRMALDIEAGQTGGAALSWPTNAEIFLSRRLARRALMITISKIYFFGRNWVYIAAEFAAGDFCYIDMYCVSLLVRIFA